MKKITKVNAYTCSDRKRVTQDTIDRNYSLALRGKHAGCTVFVCNGCRREAAVHNDHTIARTRCKKIHKTELIWNPLNFENSCAKCHNEWETFKNGKYIEHLNYNKRMRFLEKFDGEGYILRIALTELFLNQIS